jgi:predicted dehydrogenase
MGQVRARAAQALGAKVAALCDVDLSRARDLTGLIHDSPALWEPHQIDWTSLDAVFVCTPPGSRGPIELAAVGAGVPVLMENPIGISALQALPVLQALVSKPIIHAVGYMNRYRPSVLHARKVLSHAPALGLTFHWTGRRYGVPWWLREDQSGGPFNEQGTHLIDLARFLAGEITEVYAMGKQSTISKGVNEAVVVSLRFRKGFLGTGFYSCEASEKSIGLGIFLAKAPICLEGWDLHLRTKEARPQTIEAKEEIYLREVKTFFKAIKLSNQSFIKCDLRDAVQTQLVVDAVGRSILSGKAEKVQVLPDLRILARPATMTLKHY